MLCASKFVGLGLLAGSVLCALPSESNSTFEKSLSPEQKRIWKKVHQERLRIYVISLLTSLVLVGYLSPYPAQRWLKVTLILLLTGSLYMLWPKSTYMAYHLSTDQIRLLKDLGRYQRLKYHGSIAASVVSIPFLCR